MPDKLKLLLLLLFVASTAFGQLTACDSVFVRVIGMSPAKLGAPEIDLDLDKVKRLKRLYVNKPEYTITGFAITIPVTCGGPSVSNKGADFGTEVLYYMENAGSIKRLYFYNIRLQGPKCNCTKNFMINVK